MTYPHSATLTISGHDITVQAFRLDYDVRDRSCPDMTALQPPVPVEEWPMSPAKLAARAQEKLDSYGLDSPTAADAAWAVELMEHSGRHFFRRAMTEEEARADHDRSRSEWLRGEIQ